MTPEGTPFSDSVVDTAAIALHDGKTMENLSFEDRRTVRETLVSMVDEKVAGGMSTEQAQQMVLAEINQIAQEAFGVNVDDAQERSGAKPDVSHYEMRGVISDAQVVQGEGKPDLHTQGNDTSHLGA